MPYYFLSRVSHTDEMIKNRARETQQVRQSAVRTSKRNEKLAAKRGMAPAVTSPMQIEQQVQTEMNKRAVRKAQQVVKFAQSTQQQQPTTSATAGVRTTTRRRPKKPAALSATNNVEQTKVMRQIKQDGKKAAQQLQLQKNAAAVNNVPQPTGKALQAARIALKEHGIAIPRGYTLQVVPTSSARAGSANAHKPTPPTKNTAANNNNNNNNNGGGGGGPARRRRQPAPSQQR
jgi:hypothetical protein